MRARVWIPSLLMLVAAFVFAGCGSNESGDTSADATHAEATHEESPAAETSAAVSLNDVELAILAHADQLDGTADHVVAKCASCKLHMDGKAEHALQAGEYEMHFCSESCKGGFAEDMHASLQKLQMLEEGGEASEETPEH